MDRREIRLQALNKGVTPVVHMVQGDTGRVLRMYPEDMSATLFQSAVLAVHRPDDSYYSITCDFDDKDYFDADMTQALTRPGRVACQLKVSYSADLVSTYTFYVMVEPSTDGLPVEQLGYDIYDLMDAAGQIHGQPTTITTAAQMTDHAVIYLYMGSEAGYSNGHIYYWNGSAFADGGAYGGSGGGGGGGESITVDSSLSSSSTNPVQNKTIYQALQNKADDSDLNTKANKWSEVTVSSSGAVSQALNPETLYHFTGAITALTITLTAPASGQPAHYHFDFLSGSTAPTLTMPQTVVMPDSWAVEANKRYEVDILNGYGGAISWAMV